MPIDQLGKHDAIRHIAGSGPDPHDELRISVLDNVGLIPVKAFLLAFVAKAGLRVRRVPVHIGVVIIALGMFLHQAKEVHLGGNLGGIDDMEPIADQSLRPGLLQYLVEQSLKAFGPQAHPEAGEGGVVRRQFLGAQAQETFEHHVPGALLLDLPIREVVEELRNTTLNISTESQGSRPQST